jgi:hypothetical protein
MTTNDWCRALGIAPPKRGALRWCSLEFGVL